MKRCNMFQRGHSTQFAQVPQWTQLHPHTGRSGLHVCDPSGSLQSIATLIAMELECGMSLGIFPASQCQQCHPSSLQWRSDSHDNSLSGHLQRGNRAVTIELCVNEGLQIPNSNLVTDHNLGHPDHQTWRTIIETEIEMTRIRPTMRMTMMLSRVSQRGSATRTQSAQTSSSRSMSCTMDDLGTVWTLYRPRGIRFF